MKLGDLFPPTYLHHGMDDLISPKELDHEKEDLICPKDLDHDTEDLTCLRCERYLYYTFVRARCLAVRSAWAAR